MLMHSITCQLSAAAKTEVFVVQSIGHKACKHPFRIASGIGPPQNPQESHSQNLRGR